MIASSILELLKVLLIVLLSVQCIAFRREVNPFREHVRIWIQNGSVIFETAENKDIVFKSSNGGSILLNDNDLNSLIENSVNAERVNNQITSQMSRNDQKISNLEKRLNVISKNRLNALEDRVTQLISSLDEFIGTGDSRLTAVAIRTTIQNVQNLERNLYLLTQKLSQNTCLSNPCVNGGTCFSLFNGFKCLCENGWQGETCNEDVNECLLYNGTDIGCQNGAVCVNIAGSYRCECKADWRGVHCTEKHDDCNGASNEELCDHGTCVNVAHRVAGQLNYRCVCDQGWTTDGVNPACNIDVDECSATRPHCSVNPPVPCYNLRGSFKCGNCPPGFTGNGIICADINECQTNNGGCSQSPRVQCTNTYGSRVCGPCPPGFIGDGTECTFTGLCRVNNGGCNSQAKCIENNGDVRCECPAHFTGTGIGPNGCVLESNTDCESNPCIHGICYTNTSTNSFNCECFDGWTGVVCNVAIDECKSNPCRNGGTCVKVGDGFKCICDVQWQGMSCEETREACGGLFQQPFGFIKYPLTNTNENENEIDCVWVIRTDLGTVVRLIFKSFRIESSPNCSNNFLQINDGDNRQAPEIGRFCGAAHHLPNGGNFTTTVNRVYIWYRTSNVLSNNGFELSWNTTDADCGDVLDTQFGVIQFPKNGGLYQINRDCFWLLKVNPSQRIQFYFSFIAIESHTNCDHDYLKMYDGQLTNDQLLAVFCNSSQPSPLTSSNSDVLIHFHSDSVSSDRGFHLTYSAIPGVKDCGGTLTSTEGSFRSPNRMNFDGNIECNWLIRVKSTEQILLEFFEFELQNHETCEMESIEIFDGSNEEAALIGRFCGSRLANVISSKNSLFVRYRTDQRITGNGFTAIYRTFCGGFFNSKTGALKSPNYPNAYPSNQRCVYHIEVESGNIIELQFGDFDIEDLWDGCLHDFLEIREGDQENGTLIEKLCGHRLPPLIASTVNEMFLTFVTDDTLNYRGFSVNYTTVYVGCGGILKSESGIISPPSHFLMPFSASCKWFIVAPPGSVIFLTFPLFALTDNGGNCGNDFVEVNEFDDTLIGKYCGRLNLHAIQSRSNVLSVVYKRNIFAPSEGFEIIYEFRNISSLCGGVLTADTGFIRSPNFPNSYPRRSSCTWIINAKYGHQISLEAKTFDLSDGSCRYEYLEIRNGHFADSPLVGRFCGNKIQPFILSHSNTISLYFESNSTITGNGFEIYFESVISGCGGTVSQQSGTIMSPNYPLAYNHNAVCDWIIHVSKGSTVEVTLDDIDFEYESENCSSDYLELFDGNSDTTPLITKICKLSSKSVFVSSKNVMFVKFRTDSRISNRGFKLHYETNCINRVSGSRGVIESPNYPYFSIREMNCLWTVEGPRGNNITFTFSHRNLSVDDHCSVVNKSEIREADEIDYIFNICANNNTVIPLSFNASSNVVEIEFSRQSMLSMFRLEWFAVGCGGTFVDKMTGSFTSPNYPNGYPHNVECLWHIRVPLQHIVVLHFDEFSLEMQPVVSHCNTDYVEVYGGPDFNSPLLSTLCHKLTNSKTMSSSGNEMTVRFKTDRSVSGRGFSAWFEAKHGNCGGLFESVHGTFASKNYPGRFDANDDCRWLIRVQGFHRIKLVFEDFDVPRSSNCSSSYVIVYDGHSENDVPLLRHCGNSKPETIRSSSNQMLVRLKGNGISAGKGFKVNYEMICGGSVFIANNDHTSYELKSANYPYESIHLQYCNWTLKAKDPSEKIMLSFTRLKSSKSNQQCSNNYVEVREGDTAYDPLIGRYCGSQIPAPIVSQGNSLYVYLHNNAVFRAIFTTAVSTCGAILDSESGHFVSPGYPNNYPLSVECIWSITSSLGNRATLSFETFKVETSEFCNSDYVEVRENDSSGTFFGRFCGEIIPVNIPSANILWVKFRSDSFGSNAGFSAFYSLVHGIEVTGTSGVITSPQYPEVVSTNEGTFTWTITSPENTFIFVTFLDIEIVAPQFGSNCYHYVEISNRINDDSIPIAKYCGFIVPPPLVSSSNVLTITYSSFYPGKFKIKWEANETSTIEITPSQSNTSNPKNVCREIIFIDKESNFELESPGYPNSYENNLNCSWILNTLSSYHLLVEVLNVDIEGFSNSCLYDKLQFYEPLEYRSLTWKLNETLCGRNTLTLQSTSNRLRVDFTTDSSISKTGFRIRATPSCGGLIYETFGTLSTQNIINSSDCQWIVTVRPGRSISVKFTELNIESGDVCHSAFIVLRNGPTNNSPFLGNGTYCGTVIPPVLQTSSNFLFVKFSAPFNLRVSFRLEFNELSETCGGSYELNGAKKSMVLFSPNYPLPPPHDFECDWIVFSPPNTNIRFNFEMSTSIVACNKSHEYIELRDGGTINSRVIDRLCVPPKLSSYTSTENIIFIRFVTTGNSLFSTFKATANINICGGGHHLLKSTKIQSPNYPNAYSDNLECIWRIQATSSFDILSVTFEEVDLISSSVDCSSGDVLLIRDGDERGEVLGSYCSSLRNTSSIKSRGPILFVEFKSDQINAGKGFSITIKTESSDCGGIIDHAVSGQISTPGFPKASPYPKKCRWVFRTVFDRRIKISFENYNLKQNERITGKCMDELRIIKSPTTTGVSEVGELLECNNILPPPIESRTMGITLTFTSNGLNENEGFTAMYTTDDEIQCGGKISETNEDIISYGFPGTYFRNETLHCLWLLTDNNGHEYKTKAVIFEVFEIFGETENQYGDILCGSDVIVFGDGEGFPLVSEFDNYCGNKTGTDFYYLFDSSRPKNYIYLIMKYINNYRGIKAKYVIEDCGGYFEGSDYWNATSPGFPNGYTPNCLCQWQYYADYGRKIKITFNSFELENDCEKDYLMVKNGLYSDSPIIGVYCGINSPEIIMSSDDALSLIFRTDLFGTAPGFSFNVEVLSKACGGYFSDYSKTIESPNYPKQYTNNVECEWHINVKPSYHFEISFIDRFDIEMSTNCENDFVLIEENIFDSWIKVCQFCGQTAPPKLKTVSHNIRITFRTNDKITGDGFKLKSSVKCGALFTASNGIITSPAYPGLYGPQLMCEFLIERSGNDIITLEFEDFDVESNLNCKFDSLNIYGGNNTNAFKYGPFCGRGVDSQPPVITNRGSLLIVFKSDGTVERKGFKAMYRSVSCGGNMISSVGEIESPNDGKKYLPNMNCEWNIIVDEHRAIEIKFTSLSLEYCHDCSCDSVIIYDGNNQSTPLIGIFCLKLLPPIIKSSSNQLLVVFKSDPGYEEEGFKLVYRETLGEKQGCGGLLQNTTGVILTPDIDNDGFYDSNLDCIWNILVPEYTVIQLTFEIMDIEDGDKNISKCSYDYLEIRDGATYLDSLIEAFCGSKLPGQISSSENKLFIHFHSDEYVSGKGFKVKYKAINSSCGDSFLVTNRSHTITSPGYPSSFPPLARCRYHFSVDSPWFERVSFKFTQFNLSCEDGDYVEFADENNVETAYRICGYRSNLKLIGVHGVWMTFNAGSVIGGNRKFSLQISLLNCNETFDSDSGFITNSHYPLTSQSLEQCIIHISTANDTKISLYFYEFSSNRNINSTNCSTHDMEIITGSTVVATLCADALPNPIFSSSNHLAMRIHSNYSLKYYILFSSNYAPDGCGGNLTSINGVFTSPKFPETYKQNANCVWYIRSLDIRSLTFSFTEFEFNSSVGCDSNFVELYDGLEISQQNFIVRYCGNDNPSVHHFEGNTIAVRMVTNTANDGIGFRAEFVRSSSSFASKNKIITSFSKPEVRLGTVYFSGL